MNILLTFVYVSAIFLVLTTLFRATYLRTKKDAIKPYGQLVEVNDGIMHVYSMGHGEKKIVLLAGLGVPLPAVSFSPLMRTLSPRYTVICVEYFGVGFSSETSAPRTSENYSKSATRCKGNQGLAASGRLRSTLRVNAPLHLQCLQRTLCGSISRRGRRDHLPGRVIDCFL